MYLLQQLTQTYKKKKNVSLEGKREKKQGRKMIGEE